MVVGHVGESVIVAELNENLPLIKVVGPDMAVAKVEVTTPPDALIVPVIAERGRTTESNRRLSVVVPTADTCQLSALA
ncbi:unannotated protein [freshwater metagenome]|uniref:Unannotated protein n=1 Tax=freshwater metagenome TaxID=449393 RepID=A0A6J7C3V0_9ZZZZ